MINFQIGEFVWFQANRKASLGAGNGFWGVVNKIYDSYQCVVLLWSGTIKVRPEHLKTAKIPFKPPTNNETSH